MRQRRKFEQTVPVGVVARQARHLQTEDDARPSHRHLRHEVLEAVAVLRCGAGQAEVVVDGMDTLERPAQCDRAIESARKIIAGVEVMHMIKKGQMCCPDSLAVSAADYFYSLATR